MSLNYVSVDKRVGCSPVSPSPGNFSPFCRNAWRCGDILSAAQSTVQRHYDCGTHHDQAVHVHPMPFSHLTFGGLLPLYRYFSAHCAMRALNTLYQPVPHVHGVSCCRSDAERQSRPEVVARTGFHELVRGLARYLTGGHFRLLPDGFWCQNRRESDPAHYLRRYRDVFLSTGGTFQRPDITAIQRGGRPVNKAVCIK